MKNEKVTKKVVIELNGVDASQVSEMFYHFHNAFAGSIDYKDDRIIVWKDNESVDLTKSKEIGLTVYLNECEKPTSVKSKLYSVLNRIGNIISN